jgi:WD40 repeat protein
MIGGATDGSIHIWNTHKHYSRADIVISSANAYEPNTQVTCVRPSPVERGTFASRSEDGTLRLWDIRSPKAPVKTFARAHNIYPSANVDFRYYSSPKLRIDGTHICCFMTQA